MENKWEKVLSLIKKTGDRCIIFDETREELFVVMELGQYENLIFKKSDVRDLTEDELLDKINRDIAIWQTNKDDDRDCDFFEKLEEKEDVLAEDDERYYLETVE